MAFVKLFHQYPDVDFVVPKLGSAGIALYCGGGSPVYVLRKAIRSEHEIYLLDGVIISAITN